MCSRLLHPFAKPNTNSVAYYTMPLRWVMYNLYLSIAMAQPGFIFVVCPYEGQRRAAVAVEPAL